MSLGFLFSRRSSLTSDCLYDCKIRVCVGQRAYRISDMQSRGVFFNFTQTGLAKIKPTDLFKLEGNEILPFVKFKGFFFLCFCSVM